MGLVERLRNRILLTSEEVQRARIMAGDAVRIHGFGAEDRLEARRVGETSRRERRVIRRAMDEVMIWHSRFDDPDYSPDVYRLESSI